MDSKERLNGPATQSSPSPTPRNFDTLIQAAESCGPATSIPRFRPTFATPLPQSVRSQILQWRLPKPFQQHVIVGQSRAAWHTSFKVPSLNAVLDAGLVIDDSRPQNVFITHGHSDHSYNVLTYCRRQRPPDLYVPWEAAEFLDRYINSSKSLNLGLQVPSNHTFDSEGKLTGMVATSEPTSRSGTPSPKPNSKPKATIVPTEDEFDDDDDEDQQEGAAILPTHYIVPVSASSSQTFTLKTLPNISVAILPRVHTVASVGYLFTQLSNRLKPEYRQVPGPELKTLRQSGINITYEHRTPILAFLGDGDHTSLLNSPSWLVGDEAAGLSPCPVVITECSFLYESHRAQAVKTKHTLWSDLEPIIRQHQETTWVLMHFSKRYSDGSIVKFFEELEDCPKNIVVWVDGGNELSVI